MNEEEMTYVEGGGVFDDLAKKLLFTAMKAVFEGLVYSAFLAALPKVAGVLTAMKGAIVALPISRIVAGVLITGIVVGYGAMIYSICTSGKKR